MLGRIKVAVRLIIPLFPVIGAFIVDYSRQRPKITAILNTKALIDSSICQSAAREKLSPVYLTFILIFFLFFSPHKGTHQKRAGFAWGKGTLLCFMQAGRRPYFCLFPAAERLRKNRHQLPEAPLCPVQGFSKGFGAICLFLRGFLPFQSKFHP